MAPPDGTPIDPDQILRRSFTSVRRGFDPVEVQKFLLELAADLKASRERERDLQRRLDEAEGRVAELTELAPSRLSSLVGEETARVLDAANAAAAEIRSRAEENTSRLVREAQDKAADLQREAEALVERESAKAEEAVDAIRRKGDELIQQARVEAEAEAEAGRQRGREMVTEAQRVRERMLRDLARRRKLLRQQIEQLQAGRERLVAAYDVVRETLDVATEELRVAVPEAKLAAEAAALRAAEESVDDEPFEQELAALAAEAELAGEPEPEPEPEAGRTAGAAGPDGAEEGDGSEAEAAVEGPEADEARAPDPEVGRHSTAVNVIPAPEDEDGGGDDEAEDAEGAEDAEDAEGGPTSKVADLFARMKQEAGQASGAAAALEDRADGDEDADAGADDEGGEVAPGPLGQRDAAVAGIVRQLARRLKRELSDEQNELLDAVRRQRPEPTIDELLPQPEAHVERYASAAHGSLVEAVAAGAAFVDADGTTSPGQVRELGAEFAAELVAPLRDRLEGAFVAAGDDREELAERLRACYREWKTQRVDGLADHAVVAAFNRGVLDGLEAGATVRWLVADDGQASPDCEDNALAGEVAKGEPFPTGHAAPPAHQSCRCLVVPAHLAESA